MVITQTPLRISLVGGGTDLPSYYKFSKLGGKVVSTSIDKYIYVTVNHLSEYFDFKILLKYSYTEKCNDISEIKHPIIRECLKYVGINNRIEITSMADLPAGTGLGSSSSFTVGLLHALYAYKGIYRSKEQLAADACNIEINILKEPIGKQDQYAASYGGFNVIHFYSNDIVEIEPILCASHVKEHLFSSMMMFYLSHTRSASEILEDQKQNTENSEEVYQSLNLMRDQCGQVLSIISSGKSIYRIGPILNDGWNLKKSLASRISDTLIDEYYQRAIENGAQGGKLLGAGGGGCLLFYVDHVNQIHMKKCLSDLKEIQFSPETFGSRVIFIKNSLV